MESIKLIYQKNKKIFDVIFLLVISLLGVMGINYTMKLQVGDAFSHSIFAFLAFGLIFTSLWWSKKRLSEIKKDDMKFIRKHLVYSCVLALLLGLSLVVGYQLVANKMTDSGFGGKVKIIVMSASVAIPFFPFTSEIFAFSEKLSLKTEKEAESEGLLWSAGKVFIIAWISIFVLWIPVMLAYYPAIMAFDFHEQSWQALMGFEWFDPFQPIIHTLLIWISLKLGAAVNSYQLGMAFYSIFQMLVMSAAYAYVVDMIYRLSKRKWCTVLTVLFFGAFPFISILSVGVTKDGIFSACFAVFVCIFLERQYFPKTRAGKWILDIAWILVAIILCLFRNNGVYAVALFSIPFVISSFRNHKEKAWTIILCALMIILGKTAPGVLQRTLGSDIEPAKEEAYSVIMQQTARVGYYHGKELSTEDYEKLQNIVREQYYTYYYPPLADVVKVNVSVDNYPNYWKDNMGQVLKDWVNFGLMYPNEYVDAFLELTRGYWFSADKSFAECFGTNVSERGGSITTFNFSDHADLQFSEIQHKSKFPLYEKILEAFATKQIFYDLPIISVFFMPSLYVWLLFVSFLLLLYVGQKKKALVFSFPFAYFLTQLCGPVVRVRYILPLMVIIPLILALCIKDIPKSEYKKDRRIPIFITLAIVLVLIMNFIWQKKGGDSFSYSIYPLLAAGEIFVFLNTFLSNKKVSHSHKKDTDLP